MHNDTVIVTVVEGIMSRCEEYTVFLPNQIIRQNHYVTQELHSTDIIMG